MDAPPARYHASPAARAPSAGSHALYVGARPSLRFACLCYGGIAGTRDLALRTEPTEQGQTAATTKGTASSAAHYSSVPWSAERRRAARRTVHSSTNSAQSGLSAVSATSSSSLLATLRAARQRWSGCRCDAGTTQLTTLLSMTEMGPADPCADRRTCIRGSRGCSVVRSSAPSDHVFTLLLLGRCTPSAVV